MSKKIQVTPPAVEPNSEPSDVTVGEMADFTPTQRSAAQYEIRIKHLREEVAMYRNKSEGLQGSLNEELVFRARYSDLKRGKIEMSIQLMLVSLLSASGALLMGIYPRIAEAAPPQFWIGATLVGIGAILGVFVTPVTLFVCYIWPKLSSPSK